MRADPVLAGLWVVASSAGRPPGPTPAPPLNSLNCAITKEASFIAHHQQFATNRLKMGELVRGIYDDLKTALQLPDANVSEKGIWFADNAEECRKFGRFVEFRKADLLLLSSEDWNTNKITIPGVRTFGTASSDINEDAKTWQCYGNGAVYQIPQCLADLNTQLNKYHMAVLSQGGFRSALDEINIAVETSLVLHVGLGSTQFRPFDQDDEIVCIDTILSTVDQKQEAERRILGEALWQLHSLSATVRGVWNSSDEITIEAAGLDGTATEMINSGQFDWLWLSCCECGTRLRVGTGAAGLAGHRAAEKCFRSLVELMKPESSRQVRSLADIVESVFGRSSENQRLSSNEKVLFDNLNKVMRNEASLRRNEIEMGRTAAQLGLLASGQAAVLTQLRREVTRNRWNLAVTAGHLDDKIYQEGVVAAQHRRVLHAVEVRDSTRHHVDEFVDLAAGGRHCHIGPAGRAIICLDGRPSITQEDGGDIILYYQGEQQELQQIHNIRCLPLQGKIVDYTPGLFVKTDNGFISLRENVTIPTQCFGSGCDEEIYRNLTNKEVDGLSWLPAGGVVWVNQQTERLIGLQQGQSAKVVGVDPVQLGSEDFPVKENGGADIMLTDVLSEIHKTEDEQDYLLDYKIIHYDEAILRAAERVNEVKIEQVKNVTGEELENDLEQLDTTIDRTDYMIGFGIGVPGGIAVLAAAICFMWKCGLCTCVEWCRWCCCTAVSTTAGQTGVLADGATGLLAAQQPDGQTARQEQVVAAQPARMVAGPPLPPSLGWPRGQSLPTPCGQGADCGSGSCEHVRLMQNAAVWSRAGNDGGDTFAAREALQAGNDAIMFEKNGGLGPQAWGQTPGPSSLATTTRSDDPPVGGAAAASQTGKARQNSGQTVGWGSSTSGSSQVSGAASRAASRAASGAGAPAQYKIPGGPGESSVHRTAPPAPATAPPLQLLEGRDDQYPLPLRRVSGGGAEVDEPVHQILLRFFSAEALVADYSQFVPLTAQMQKIDVGRRFAEYLIDRIPLRELELVAAQGIENIDGLELSTVVQQSRSRRRQ